jgi:hypothetical protein
MVAPQAGQKREDGSTGLPHLEQNMWVSGSFYFATGTMGSGGLECGGFFFVDLGWFRSAVRWRE